MQAASLLETLRPHLPQLPPAKPPPSRIALRGGFGVAVVPAAPAARPQEANTGINATYPRAAI